ncbi:hypothetical protein BD324DRAFT_389912 [Kockovaella imperatae]|uniref:Uncharacterized protein n=1 Tax=Kockovaella imperatae TaxID=4999 RepID=A0A1Y1UJD6_9TREE|nr:hypothetical protein BD324DRAFT_389912 [Kockovaella imperatae]ORX37657.1 hypothetical protein BD324DRAFT_389912 [Kockovaella imperatae]
MTAVQPSPTALYFPHSSQVPHRRPTLSCKPQYQRRPSIHLHQQAQSQPSAPCSRNESISAWQSALLSPSPSPPLVDIRYSTMVPVPEASRKPSEDIVKREYFSPPVYRSPPPLPRLDTATRVNESQETRGPFSNTSTPLRKVRTTPTNGHGFYPTPVSVTERPDAARASGDSRMDHDLPLQYQSASSASQNPTRQAQPPQQQQHQQQHPMYRSPALSPDRPAFFDAHTQQGFPGNLRSTFSPRQTPYLSAHRADSPGPGPQPYATHRPKLSIHPYAPPVNPDARYHSAGASRLALPFGQLTDFYGSPGSAISPGGIKAPLKRGESRSSRGSTLCS